MNSNQTPSAPPPGWTPDEKSAMGQSAPPPYQDHPKYPAQAYPPQQVQGYGSPPQYGGAPYVQQPYPMGAGQQYPPGTNVVTVQPTVYVTRAPLANPVNDYMGYSVFTLLCCCLPLGVAALIYSIMARDANQSGDHQSAERNSRTARILNHVAVGIGIVCIILSIVYMTLVTSSF